MAKRKKGMSLLELLEKKYQKGWKITYIAAKGSVNMVVTFSRCIPGELFCEEHNMIFHFSQYDLIKSYWEKLLLNHQEETHAAQSRGTEG